MLGPRKIDSLGLSILDIDGDLRRAGAMRRVAEVFAARDAMITCVRGVESGDALALATRFDRGWAYRGSTALFWHRRIVARKVYDRYMPIALMRPFDLRGVLHVEADFENQPLDLLALRFGHGRVSRIRDVRFARSILKKIQGAAVFFAANAAQAQLRFEDLGFHTVAADDYSLIVVRPSQATPPPQTAGSQEASASIERI